MDAGHQHPISSEISRIGFAADQRLAAIGLLICLAGVRISEGRLLTDVDRARRIARTPSFRVGSLINDPKTLKIRDLGELFRLTTGNVRPRSILRHGDFAPYWKVSYPGRSGKAFEAFEAYRANRKLARMGRSERLLITALEPELGPHHPADIVMTIARGEIIKEFQLKTGAKATIEALDDSRYSGMTFVTPRDSLEEIRTDLKKAKVKAARRGPPLSNKWQKIDRALSEGRLTDEIVPGLRTRSRGQIGRIAERYTRELYEAVSERMAKYAPEPLKQAMSSVLSGEKGSKRLVLVPLKTVRRALAVADFVFIGYQTHSDVQRYRKGELGGEVLAAKSVLRVGELAVAILLLSPDPGTKLIEDHATLLVDSATCMSA